MRGILAACCASAPRGTMRTAIPPARKTRRCTTRSPRQPATWDCGIASLGALAVPRGWRTKVSENTDPIDPRGRVCLDGDWPDEGCPRRSEERRVGKEGERRG